jgi:tRNA A-37 threonylcarbamoyl transferase component Bud32
MNYNLLLITQDNNLADDILELNNSKSVKSKYTIDVKRINKYGYFSGVGSAAKAREDANRQRSERNQPPQEAAVPEEEKFEICHTVTSIKDDIIRVSHIPHENEKAYVFYNGQFAHINLIKELGAGGEATIYTTNTPFIAKIYKESNNTKRKHEKIKRMLSKPIDCKGICYPVAEVFNSSKEFVGYLMPEAKGKELQRSIFLVKQLFLKNFPGWKKRDTVELCITILEKIKYLHDRNIIMGDINPANILVVSPTEVYFVDTDSYQMNFIEAENNTFRSNIIV